MPGRQATPLTTHIKPCLIALAIVGLVAMIDQARGAEPETIYAPADALFASPDAIAGQPSSAYPNGSFGQQLAAASNGTGGGGHGLEHRTGPGRRDDWLVGPRWKFEIDGVALWRDGADLGAILGALPDPPGAALEFQENFDYSAGARLQVTSEWPKCQNYEIHVGYVGVEDWTATAFYELETIAAPGAPGSDVDVFQRRSLEYDSSLHSLELNFQRITEGYLKPYAGVRYVSFDEDLHDRNDQFLTGPVPNPPSGVGNTLTGIETDTLNGVAIDNDLIGFQLGLRLNTERPYRRFAVSGFVNGGVYVNLVDRDTIYRQQTTSIENEVIDTDPDVGVVEGIQTTTTTTTISSLVAADGTNVAFVGEAALAGVWRLNDSFSLRGGYQVLVLTGVEMAEDLWVGGAPVEQEHVLHGWFAGLECRR